MAKTTPATLHPTSADENVDSALEAMQAQIDALEKRNADLVSRMADGRPGENEKFKAVDLEDPAVMTMMERRGAIPTHPATGEPIFNPLRAAMRPPA